MSALTPPNEPTDSEPNAAPSVPDPNLWSDSETLPAPPGSVSTAAAPDPQATDTALETIGHIGRYALKYRIGEGGLGTVYAAHDPLLTRLIAIKTLNLEIGADEREAFNALFLREARAAASLSHPNIVTVFDAGVSDNSAYIAMELLKGRDLRQLRKEGWRPTPMQAALIARRVADALAYAHVKGIVHCDVKPANIFMVGRTQPRVLDFGIARIAHHHDGSTGSHLAAGSPYYMAPEQVRNETVDRRADVFSLGVVLYELLTDHKPFRGNSLEAITGAVLAHEPPPAHVLDASVPEALSLIAARAMAKDPELRFRSARSLSRELRHWIDEQTQGAEGTVATMASPAGTRKRVALAAAAGLVAAVAAGLWATSETAPRVAVQVAAQVAAPVARPSPAPGPQAAAAPEPEPAMVTTRVVAAAPLAPPAVVPETVAAVERPVPVVVLRPPPVKQAAKPAPKPGPNREARPAARDAKVARATAPASTTTGTVRIAVSPWGQIEVDGAPAGTTPPLAELKLTEGRHRITVRNADFPPHTVTVDVDADQPVTLKHRFGS